jgi:hypothetical protein
MTKTTIANRPDRPYGLVRADYVEGDVSTYRGMVMEYADKKGAPQEKRFYLPPTDPNWIDAEHAYGCDREAAEAWQKHLGMDMVWLSSCDDYGFDIDPEWKAQMEAQDAREAVALYREAATCGLVAVVAHKVGLEIGDFKVNVVNPDDKIGEAEYYSDLIGWARGQASSTSLPHAKMEALAFLLAAGGDTCVEEGRNIGIILAGQNCTLTEEETWTPEHQWMHLQDVNRWWALLNIDVADVHAEWRDQITAIAEVLIRDGEINAEDALAIIHTDYEDAEEISTAA